MGMCEVCGNEYDKAFTVTMSGKTHTFDSGHCAAPTAELPHLIVERRAEIADRIAGLQALDARLSGLLGHLDRPRPSLAVLDGRCCDAAGAIVGMTEGGCACCSPAAPTEEKASPRPARSRGPVSAATTPPHRQ